MTYLEEVGKIDSTFLGIEDHGILTAVVGFNFGGSGQSFGSFCFDYRDKNDKYVGNPECARFIRLVCEAAGVDNWERLKGRTLIVLREERNGYIKGLKPLPFENGKAFIWDEEIEL